MGANVQIAKAMGETTKTMGNMNKIMNPMKVGLDTLSVFVISSSIVEQELPNFLFGLHQRNCISWVL